MSAEHAPLHSVRTVENAWIPLADGCRLAARLWLPEGAERAPVPAILESIPYRKRDGTRRRDERMHGWFAARGYAAVRVDLRGTGDSDGVLLDEYLPQEQQDGLEVLRWIAAQPWCDGSVGMLGKSWGAFAALQLAALAPPELRAVISVCGTDDRYRDDAHYMGGCLLNENLVWGASLLTLCALPPDPELVGARWRRLWAERVAALRPFPAPWLAHARRDAYWRHGSVGEDPGRIRCPVLAVSGWADGYSNAVPRLLTGLGPPSRALIGPWAHLYPHEGVPGPAIGFLQEALRWWRRWLGPGGAQASARGADGEPAYRVWMQEDGGPEPDARRPGRWVAEERWPAAHLQPTTYRLVSGGLVPGPQVRGEEATLQHRSPLTTGLAGGAWCGFGHPDEAAGDQREDDRGSLVFDSAPLREPLEILGAATLELELAVDRPLAFLAARLNLLAADGGSRRVTYGLLNLTHRDGHERPRPLVPGRRSAVRLRLNDVAHAFAPGQRLRLALSTAYWPMVWPSPQPVSLTLFTQGCRLTLPVRPPRPADARLRPFEAPESARAGASRVLTPAVPRRTRELDPHTGETVTTVVSHADAEGEPALEHIEDIDLVHGHALTERYRLHPDDPLSARGEVEQRVVLRRGTWSVRVDSRVRLSATADEFLVEAELDTWEGGRRRDARRWRERVARDHV